MDIINIIGTVYPRLIIFLLIMARISAVLFTFSVLRSGMATARILLALTVILSYFVLINNPDVVVKGDLFSMNVLVLNLVQIFIGVSAGILLNIAFEVFSALGQIVSTQIGLSTASLFDPKFGMITTLSHFYLILAIIIFFSINGHLIMIEILDKSFSVLPVNVLLTNFDGMTIVKFARVIFSGSILISLTLIVAILMTNICLAIMSKFAPQFNLFSVGMNMTIIIGLIIAYLCFYIVVERSQVVLEQVIGQYKTYLMGIRQ